MSRKMKTVNETEITDTKILGFLDAQNPKTRKTYESIFKRVLEFSGNESGQSMLENAKEWSRKILMFQQWLIKQEYSLCSVENMTGALRGFFAFYDAQDFRLSRTDRRKLGRKARNTEDFSFSQQDVKKCADVANLEEKYVLFSGCSMGLRSEDTIKLTFGKYRAALENAEKEGLTVPIPLGKVNTSKEDVDAYPFISSDFLPIVKAILDAHKDAKDTDLVFPFRTATLTANLQNIFHKSGIDSHGQTVRYHCLRKYLFDRLVSVSSVAKASQIIGHKISGEISAYIGEDSLRTVYEKAMSSIVVTNGNGDTKKKVEALSTTTDQLIKMLADRDKTIEDLKAQLAASQSQTMKEMTELRSMITQIQSQLPRKEEEKKRFVVS